MVCSILEIRYPVYADEQAERESGSTFFTPEIKGVMVFVKEILKQLFHH
jgi:hypothetical protein